MSPAARALFDWGHSTDSRLTVTSVRRTRAEQSRLYARYLAGESQGIPALPPGQSMHEKGRAFDLARPGVDPFSDELLARLGALWSSWGGRWHPTDPVHFEA
jgi:hypothetical protein